jgi:prepilin-type N-terminal cleavage/methylation domain-containing protein
MFKSHTNSNSQKRAGRARSGFDVSPLEFGFVSDFGFRVSDLSRRRGFSFTEIMFAVVILGIGFIMVAAIFPVSLQQSKSTAEEIAGAGSARGAAAVFEAALSDGPDASNRATNTNIPPTGTTQLKTRSTVGLPYGLTPATQPSEQLWNILRGNLVQSDDPRYGFVYLYRRDGDLADTTTWAPYVQVFIFPVQVRAKTTFTHADSEPITNVAPWTTTNPICNLMARRVRVAIAQDLVGGSVIAFDTDTSVPQDRVLNVEAAAEGAYVVISDDKITTPTASAAGTIQHDARGRMNGRVYRLGARRQDLDSDSAIFPTVGSKVVYDLAPGNDFTFDPGADGVWGPNPNDGIDDDIIAIGMDGSYFVDTLHPSNSVRVAGTAEAFLIGRGFADPANPAGYEDAAMPISAYTTFVKVK